MSVLYELGIMQGLIKFLARYMPKALGKGDSQTCSVSGLAVGKIV